MHGKDPSLTSSDDGGELLSDQAQSLLFECVDRLNAGERIDLDRIEREHPDIAPEVIRQLKAFEGIQEDHAEPLLGTLGDYTLRRQIGRGGMGVVYEAWQNSVDRPVALKVLPAGIAADNKAFLRFMREARTAAQLGHQNVVGVYGMGQEDNTPYFAMEYVEGETLAQVLERLRGTEPETDTPFGRKDDVAYFANLARAFADVADGLQHAHSKRVIHRDIKPSNLILDREGKLLILDFGLARLEGQDSLTLSGDLMGTVLYMSPEQAMAKRVPLDHRTDVYSLGATMYEALTGAPPFRGRTQHDTLSQIIVRAPRSPRQLNPRVPKDFETIVLKCLRKDPGDRYGTAEALAQDLRRYVRGDPIEARPEGQWERLARRLRRNRKKVILGAVVLVLLGSVAWLSWRGHQAGLERRLAEYEPHLREALAGYYEARFSVEAVKTPIDFLQGPHRGSSVVRENLVNTSDFRKVVPGDVVSPLEQAVEALTEVSESVAERPDALYHLAQAYQLLENPAAALTAIEQVLAIDPDFVPARVFRWELQASSPVEIEAELASLSAEYPDSDQWQHWWLLAWQSAKSGSWTEAVAACTELIERFGDGTRRALEPFVGMSFEAYMQRGVARLEARESRNAHQDFNAARVLNPGLAPGLLLGKAYHVEVDEEFAEEIFEDLYRKNPNRHREIALWVVAMKDALWSYDDHHLRWIERLDDSSVADLLYANCLFRLGRTRAARAHARQAIDRDPGDPRAYVILGLCHLEELRSGQGPPGEEILEELIEVSRRAVELDPANPVAIQLDATARNYHERSNDMQFDKALLSIFTLGLGQVTLAQGAFEDVRPLGPAVNSFYFETQPVVSEDGLEIYFSSGRCCGAGGMDVWRATRTATNDPFENPVPVSSINSPANDWPTWLSPDGERLYFMSTRRGNSDMFVAESTGPDSFEDVRPLDEINTGFHEGGGTLSLDERTIYYVSTQLAGGQGGRDIWVATRTSIDVPFENPRNLKQINTQYEEANPSISSDGLTLFWSELGDVPRPGGVGSRDIWYATREGAEDDFGPAMNLGPPVNSPQGESAVKISSDWPAAGSKIYFMRCGADCVGDLYEATWVPEPVEPLVTFRRGDANDDGTVNIADGVATLSSLFAGIGSLPCGDAADVDDSGELNVADAIRTFNWLFLGGATPAPPGPTTCGEDPTADPLDCNDFASCP